MIQLRFAVLYVRAVIGIAGMFGSILVISGYLRFSKLRTITNKYIVNLCIACLINSFNTAFYKIHANFNYVQWQFSLTHCKIHLSMIHIHTYAFGFFLVAICVDRYLAIVWPACRTRFVSNVVMTAVWIASILLSIPTIMYTGIYNDNCDISWPNSEDYTVYLALTVYFFIMGLAVPLFLVAIFTILVALRLNVCGNFNGSSRTGILLNRSAAEADDVNGLVVDQSNWSAQDEREINDDARNVSIDVIMVTAIWTLCTIPYAVCDMLTTFYPNFMADPDFVALNLSMVIQAVSELMLPVWYILVSNNYRKCVVKLFTCAADGDVNASLRE